MPGGITLSLGEEGIFLWAMIAVMVAVTLLFLVVLYFSYLAQSHITFTDKEIIIPTASWSARQKPIAYVDIQNLSLRSELNQQWLVIIHTGAQSNMTQSNMLQSNITKAMLAKGQTFDEVMHLLRDKVRNVQDPSHRGPHRAE
jgi:uncharacterized membrane protein